MGVLLTAEVLKVSLKETDRLGSGEGEFVPVEENAHFIMETVEGLRINDFGPKVIQLRNRAWHGVVPQKQKLLFRMTMFII